MKQGTMCYQLATKEYLLINMTGQTLLGVIPIPDDSSERWAENAPPKPILGTEEASVCKVKKIIL